jgi:hypothetical protein
VQVAEDGPDLGAQVLELGSPSLGVAFFRGDFHRLEQHRKPVRSNGHRR